MVEKNIKKYGYSIKNIKIIDNNLIFISNDNVRVLDKTDFTPKVTIQEKSIYSSLFQNRVALFFQNELKIINFMEDKLISSLKIEGVSTLSLSSVLVAVGKERGSVSIVSVIGGKLLLNLNIFKTKIKKIEFYNENIVFCQTDNSIRAIDIIENKIVLKFVNESIISNFYILKLINF